ncbi:tRNA (guanosine(37)-N1)-methyltransferase TrmD [Buchnera aphidicola]|uniref:tRNA (guanosine(37)-N1)-methyltransferase TrmD n=1 Tax=Buchnera aphidicola TaxID=9 RepID=UPI003463D76C
MWIGIISIFPEMFNAILNYGITSKAIKKKIISINIWNPRNFSNYKHQKVDDRPYGGGSGMLMMFEPLKLAIAYAKLKAKKKVVVIYLSPQGEKINQKKIYKISKYNKIILICGRYLGIDERIIENEIDEEWSIGDYILTGGELAAMVIIDSISRLQPGIIKKKSLEEESFSNGILNHPNYTRPKSILGKNVPKILLSGHHKNIKIWKITESLRNTIIKRPDLLKKIKLSHRQNNILKKLKSYK